MKKWMLSELSVVNEKVDAFRAVVNDKVMLSELAEAKYWLLSEQLTKANHFLN